MTRGAAAGGRVWPHGTAGPQAVELRATGAEVGPTAHGSLGHGGGGGEAGATAHGAGGAAGAGGAGA